jgi:hypothetical protein
MSEALLRFVGIYLTLSVFASVALVLDTWPRVPTSRIEWTFLFVIALPVTFLGDWLSQGLLTNPFSVAIERRTRGSTFSWLRVLYLLGLYSLFAICTVSILYWANT